MVQMELIIEVNFFGKKILKLGFFLILYFIKLN